MNNDSLFGGLVSVTRCTICLCSTFWLFSYVNLDYVAGIKLLPFWGMSIAVFLILKAFLLKPRSQNSLIAFACILFAAETAAILLFFFELEGRIPTAFAIISVGIAVILSVIRCIEPVSHAKTLNSMELTVVYFIFFLWAQTAEAIEPGYCIPLLFASVLSIIDVMRMRISGIDNKDPSSRIKSTAVAIVVLAATLIPIALFAHYGAKPLGNGMTSLFYAIFYCIDAVCKALIFFIVWLASLFPPPDNGWFYEKPQFEFDPDELPSQAEPDPNALFIMQLLLLAAAAVLILLILYRFRHRKVGGKLQTGSFGSVSRKKLSFFNWLRSVFAAVKRKITLGIRIMLSRGSAKGLYLFVLKKGKPLGLHRLPGETPCAFVIRAAQMAENSSEDMRQALILLSDELSLSLYSNRPQRAFPKAQAELIRRGFRKSLRKAKLNMLISRIKALLAR